MYRLLSALFLIVGLISCREKSDKYVYSYRVPEQKLKDLLIDVNMVEAAMSEFLPAKQDSIKKVYMTQLLKIHQLDEVGLNTIMTEVKSDEGLSHYIYEMVSDSLKALRLKMPKGNDKLILNQ